MQIEQPELGPLPHAGPAIDHRAVLRDIGPAAVGIDRLVQTDLIPGKGHARKARRSLSRNLDRTPHRHGIGESQIMRAVEHDPAILPQQHRAGQADDRQQNADDPPRPAVQEREQLHQNSLRRLSVKVRPRPEKNRRLSVTRTVSLS